MDQQQLTIARNYLAGNEGSLTIDSLPALATVRVETVEADRPEQPVYVADSANTASSIATGVVTSQGRISRDAAGTLTLPTILEQAQAAGYRTGLVTTSSVTDATPAAFASHSAHRKCQGPRSLAKTIAWYGSKVDCAAERVDKGGPGSIAHQLSTAKLDVLLGGGLTDFEQAGYGGEPSPMETLEANYTVVRSPLALQQFDGSGPLAGLFALGNLPVELMGEGGRKAKVVLLEDDTLPVAGEVFDCIANPDADAVPTLRTMTDKALSLLASDDSKGFFLMVESASIDKQSHARQTCGHIGEVRQLDQALLSALDFAAKHPNTLILVTADHAHAAQIIPDQAQFRFGNRAFHSPGAVARIRTPEGSIMMVNYATSNSGIEMHTGTNVPLYASGPGVEKIPSQLRQRDIYQLMADFLGL